MKITVNVECTPEEARTFIGLPDVRPLQDAMMVEIENRMRSNMQAMAPDALVKTWIPAGIEGAEQLQKMFWSHMQKMVQGFGDAQLTLNGKQLPGQKTGS